MEEGVGERSPPRDGVRVGVGMDGGISSRSSSKDKLDAVDGLAGFATAEVLVSSSLSSEELEDDVPDAGLALGLDLVVAVFAAGLTAAFFLVSTFWGATAGATSASDSEELEESDSDELESGLESTLSSPPPFALSWSSSLS